MKIRLFLILVLVAVLPSIVFAGDLYSLMPRPKFAFPKAGQFIVSRTTPLVIATVGTTTVEKNAVAYFQKLVKSQIGDTLQILPIQNYSGGTGIIIGNLNTSLGMKVLKLLDSTIHLGETEPQPQGYWLDASPERVILAGIDDDGTFNGVSTLAQLFTGSGTTATISPAHIWDFPDYPNRWIFSQHNLIVTSVLNNLRAISDTMSAYKLNGLQNSDFKYSLLQLMGQLYFNNVDTLKRYIASRNIEMIPGIMDVGWSAGVLTTQPNLAEGLPAKATYIIEADTGRMIPSSPNLLPNGNFETVGSNGQFSNWSFYDGAGQSTFPDSTVFHSGKRSVRCENFLAGNPAGNCRFQRTVSVLPNTYFSMSAWVKTENLQFQGGQLQLLALGQDAGGKNHSLTFTSLNVPSTAGWTRVEVNFNSLDYPTLLLYLGVWNAKSGKIWFDDFEIHEAGLANVLRRKGTPLSVKNKKSGAIFQEGIDFATVVDPILENSHGNYFPNHTPPTFRRTTSGAIKNGDTVIISFYHPFVSISDNSGNGSVMVCVSEDSLYTHFLDQTQRVNNLYHPAKFFMGHDEIRNMNHDDACLKRGLSPSKLLSDNITHCSNIIKTTSPTAEIFMWNDMVDSLHNAHDNYYLVNGDLTGDWNDIPKDITIANWNSGNAKQSLKFFADKGFRQMTCPYFDVGNSSTIRAWRLAQEGVANMRGMIYTTWASDYNFLRPFGYYAWGAGPYIVHVPLDSATSALTFSATVLPDPFDNSDGITSVQAEILDSAGTLLKTVPMILSSQNQFTGTTPNVYQPKGFRYRITAQNKQMLTRFTPTFSLLNGNQTDGVPENTTESNSMKISPNPAFGRFSIAFSLPKPAHATLEIFDLAGNCIATLADAEFENGNHEFQFNTEEKALKIADGMYFVRLQTDFQTLTQELRLFR